MVQLEKSMILSNKRGTVKLTAGLMTVVPKNHRKVIKVASKRPVAIVRPPTAVKREHIPVDPCDNSNDSGLGFDHHIDFHPSITSHSTLCFSDKETGWQPEEPAHVKRQRLEIKLESDDANDNFTFPQTVRQVPRAICVPVRAERPSRVVPVPTALSSQLSATSQNGLTQLLIVCQPEQQHRARYQTEGSRGAVKDRTGNGFPMVKLVGYDQPATLQVFIGTDQGRIVPHMFYQACRVSGKNSTPCVEKKLDGTIVIEVDIEPSKDMVVTCDCVGILKERNVDVEHRFPEEGAGRTKKKSTRCRMVFRTTINNPDGSQETLQVSSQPIVCTQPPGVPEICKKSLSSCSVRGGQELFILGKNFLKDTRVVFQEGDWSQSVQPDKEFLQQSHLVCTVPPYHCVDISEPVTVRLLVESSGKASEPHNFLYLPDTSPSCSDSAVLVPEENVASGSIISQGGSAGVFPTHLSQPMTASLLLPSESSATATFVAPQTSTGREENIHPVMLWEKSVPVEVMMPPPGLLPISVRRASVQMIVPEPLEPENLKQEIADEVPKPLSDLSSSQQPSMDTFHRFVTNNTLPSITVENYLSNIEGNARFAEKMVKSQIIGEVPRIMIPTPTSVNKPLASSDSASLLTTVEPMLVSQPVGMAFDNRNICANPSVSQASHENISVIVPSPLIQKKASESHLPRDVQQENPQQQNVTLDLLMRSALNERPPTMTEKLDAFVNSAAESHISPNPNPIITSVITENTMVNPISDMVVNTADNMSELQEQNISPMTQSTAMSLSPQTSPHHSSANIGDAPLCSLMNSPQNTSNQTQVVSNIQATFEHHMNNQNVNTAQANINDLIKASQKVSADQAQVYSNLQTSLEQQLTSQAMTSSQMTHSEISSMMQSSQPTSTNQGHVLSNLQSSLEQHLSPSAVNPGQLIHPNLNDLIQSSHTSSTQEQTLANLQASLEQQMSSHNVTSQSQIDADLSNLIQSAAQESRREAQALSNLQASLEQQLSQGLNSSQMIHPESIQPTNLSLNSIGKTIHTSTQSSISENQSLSNLQASLEHHMSSQMLNSVQAAHESLTNISTNTLNSSVPTSPQVQIAVSQAQVLSNIQASLEHHLASQVVASVQAIHETVTSNQMTNRLNSPVDNSAQIAVNQGQALSNLQMSFDQLNQQVLTSPQPTHENMAIRSISLNNAIQTSQAQISVSQVQTLSNLQASLEHHLSSNVMGTTQSSESVLPLERLNNSIPTSPQNSSNQNLSNLQASIDHLSSQVLSSSQSSHAENNLSMNDSRSIDLTSPMSLMSAQAINVASDTSSTNSPVMILSPNSHQSPSSAMTTPGLSMSNSPTMALSPPNSLAMEINPSNIVLNASHTMLSATDITMRNPSALLNQSDLQMQSSPGVQLQTSISQFEQVASRIPDKIAAMSQFQHGQGVQDMNKEADRVQPGTASVQPHTNFEMKPQPAVKKCEELTNELTQMSEHDLISYINPSCFDTVDFPFLGHVSYNR